MPFSPSSSHLSFLPKSCFHSCILLLMFTLCGPFLIRKQKKHPNFLSYCNLRLSGVQRPSDLLSALPFLSSLDLSLLDGCRTSGAPDWGWSRCEPGAFLQVCLHCSPTFMAESSDQSVKQFVLSNELFSWLKQQPTVLNVQG